MNNSEKLRELSMFVIRPAGNTNFWANQMAGGCYFILYTKEIKLSMATINVINPRCMKVHSLVRDC